MRTLMGALLAAGLVGGFGCGNSTPATLPDDDPAVRAEDERRHKEIAADEEAARKERLRQSKKGRTAGADE
jgi:hypothetical protein